MMKNYDNKLVSFKCFSCDIDKPTKSMCVECKRRKYSSESQPTGGGADETS